MLFRYRVPRHMLEEIWGDRPRDMRIEALLDSEWWLSLAAYSVMVQENGGLTDVGRRILLKLLEVIGSKYMPRRRGREPSPKIVYIFPGEKETVYYGSLSRRVERRPEEAEITIPGLDTIMKAAAEPCEDNPKKLCIIIWVVYEWYF